MQEEERAVIDQSNQAREQGAKVLADLIIAHELVSLKRQAEADRGKLLEKELEIAKLNASRKVLLNQTIPLDARGLIEHVEVLAQLDEDADALTHYRQRRKLSREDIWANHFAVRQHLWECVKQIPMAQSHNKAIAMIKMAYSSFSVNIHDIRSLQAGSIDNIHIAVPPISEEHARLLSCIGTEWGIEVVVHRSNPEDVLNGKPTEQPK